MLSSYIVGLGGAVVIAVAWVAVQLAWRRTFPDAHADPDALAGRMGCSGCNDPSTCEKDDPRCPDR